MKKFIYLVLFALIAAMPVSLTSCSETNEEENEFADWQQRNDTYFANVYNTAKTAIASGDSSWKIIHSYSKSDTVTSIKDFIVAKVISSGGNTEYPLFTDSVKIHYRGYLMLSASYDKTIAEYGTDPVITSDKMHVGYQFDSSWTDSYNLATMMPYSGTAGSFVNGFTTALQKMGNGDRWLVFIPYPLGYGTTAQSSIPAYSTMIFDLTLVKSWKKRISD